MESWFGLMEDVLKSVNIVNIYIYIYVCVKYIYESDSK